jgi:hypothetical protein
MGQQRTTNSKVRLEPWSELGTKLGKFIQENFERAEVMRTCLTCHFFLEKTETCSKFNNQRPPARIIANGCDAYDDFDNIPF